MSFSFQENNYIIDKWENNYLSKWHGKPGSLLQQLLKTADWCGAHALNTSQFFLLACQVKNKLPLLK
jgi:hypothetical protein